MAGFHGDLNFFSGSAGNQRSQSSSFDWYRCMGACILSAGNSTIFGLVVTLHNIIGGALDILTGLDVLLRAMYLTLFDAMLISYSSLHK